MVNTSQEKQGYKYTEEFGYIPEDWEIKNIVKTSSLKARIGWQGLTTAEYLNSGDYLLVTGTDFDNGKISWSSCFYVEKKRYAQDTNIQLRKGDVLITKDGTIGKVAYIDDLPKPTTLNSGVFVVRPMNEAYNTKYFYYLLQSNIFISFLNKLKAGSTIVHLYQKDLSNFDYIMPSDIKEQEKIAEVLGDIDSLIDKTQQLINKKKDIKTATMQKLLTPKDDWESITLGEIGKISMCKRIMKNETSENGEIPFYKIGTFGEEPDAYISKELFELFSRKYSYPRKGDILISAAGTIGRTIIYDGKPAYFQDSNIVWLEHDEKKVLNKYLFYLYKTNPWYTTTGGTIARLYNDNISKAEISIPKNLNEQNKIATVLSDMDAEIEALEKELSKYKYLKTGMMQQLLTGKIRLIGKSVKQDDKVVSIEDAAAHKVANDEFKDAILISVLAYKFGNEQYPLGAFRRQKLSYFYKRHANMNIDEYTKKAMGPYNSKMKYQGAENIAIRNKYVKKVGNRGIVATNLISKAEEYYNRYYNSADMQWLDANFHYENNNNLEVLATVDYAINDLVNQNKAITLSNIKTYIASDEEWRPKLELDYFTDNAIIKAMEKIKKLFNSY